MSPADPGEERAALWQGGFALQEQIAAHPSQAIVDRLQIINRAQDIFRRNSAELTAILEAPVHNEDLAAELFQNTRPPLVKKEYLAEVDQRLHNYVASVMSLVEHTRKQVRKIYSDDVGFFEQYEDRVVRPFADSPIAMFLQDLRDYVLHNDLPLTGTRVTITPETGATGEVLVATASLLRWDRWSARAKEHLATAGETVNLRSAVATYEALYDRSYRWLEEVHEWAHADLFAERDDLIRRHAEIRARLMPPDSLSEPGVGDPGSSGE